MKQIFTAVILASATIALVANGQAQTAPPKRAADVAAIRAHVERASDTQLHPDGGERQMSRFHPLTLEERAPLFAAREAVWRAWYAGDIAALQELLPVELITLGSDAGAFGTRRSVLEGSKQFAGTGAKLTRLAFPRTEIQAYGLTVILYTSYELDLERGGRTRTERGVATEVFVMQHGRWLNTGWQLAHD